MCICIVPFFVWGRFGLGTSVTLSPIKIYLKWSEGWIYIELIDWCELLILLLSLEAVASIIGGIKSKKAF